MAKIKEIKRYKKTENTKNTQEATAMNVAPPSDTERVSSSNLEKQRLAYGPPSSDAQKLAQMNEHGRIALLNDSPIQTQLSGTKTKRQRLEQAAELEKTMSPEEARIVVGRKKDKRYKSATELLKAEKKARKETNRKIRKNQKYRDIENFVKKIKRKRTNFEKTIDTTLREKIKKKIDNDEEKLKQMRKDLKNSNSTSNLKDTTAYQEGKIDKITNDDTEHN